MHRRVLLFALLALAVPLPALALSGGDSSQAPAGPGSLAVSSSLEGCGTADARIVCKIDSTWNAIPGATRYTASVTRADGSVMDYGEVGAGSASFWVPYVGNGTYTVSISAYGTPPGARETRVVARGSSDTASGSGDPDPAAEAPGQDRAGSVPGDEVSKPGQEPPADPEDPSCEDPAEPDPEGEEPGGPDSAREDGAVGSGEGNAQGAPLSAGAASELDELPDSVDCPEPGLPE